MRIPWRKIAWIALVAIPVAAVGVVLWLSTRDLSRYQARLVEQVRKVTGRELTTRVPLAVHLGRQPALVAEGVTLSNAPWGSRPDLARVRKVTMFLDPFSLFLGDPKIGRVLLEGADILVEHNEAGDANLEMLPPPDGSGPRPGENRSLRLRTPPAFPWISTIEVRDSTLRIVEGAGRAPIVLDVARIVLKAPAPNQTLQMEGRIAAPQAAAFDLSGTVGSFDGWMRGLPGNIDVQGGFGDGKISIKGGVGVKGTSLQIAANGPDIAAFGPYLRLSLPSGGPYSLNAKAGTQRNGFKVEVPALKVGASELAGEAVFRTDRHGTPTLTVNIDAARIDAGGLKAAPASAQPAPTQPRLIPSQPFAASWLGRSTLSVTARVGEVTGLSSKVQNGSITMAAGETRFTFRAAATIGGGSAGLDLVYDPAGRIGQTTLTASANRVSFEDLSSLLGLDLGLREAVGDIDLRLRGGGRTTRDALNSASGTIEVSTAKGIWPRDSISAWPSETQRLLGNGDTGAPFNCIAGRFEVSGGVANLRRLVVDTPRATLVGGGFLHLRSEAWEFILAPEARDAQGAALATPLRLKGGSGRPTTGALEPALAKLLIGAGVVPSLTGTLSQIARQAGVNACALMAPRVEGLRPGLRAQLPTPSADLRAPNRRPPTPQAAPAPQTPPRRTP